MQRTFKDIYGRHSMSSDFKNVNMLKHAKELSILTFAEKQQEIRLS